MVQFMIFRKMCVLGDLCIVCGFFFVQYERIVDGKDIIYKFYQLKFKLNLERIEYIKKVSERFDI